MYLYVNCFSIKLMNMSTPQLVTDPFKDTQQTLIKFLKYFPMDNDSFMH